MHTLFISVVYFGSCVCNRLDSLASMFSVVPTICFGFQVRFYLFLYITGALFATFSVVLLTIRIAQSSHTVIIIYITVS